MATTQNTFTGNGSNLGPFSFTFKWLESTDIKVSVGGVLKTAGTHYNLQSLNYTTKTGGQVLFTAGNAPANGTSIRIYRDTDDEALSAVFSSGSAIRAKDLNDNFTQNLYVTQETNNHTLNVDGSIPMRGNLNMDGYQIDNLATPTASGDAATKDYVDAFTGNTGIPGHTRWRKLASAGQTVFSGTGDYGGTLSYSPVREQVYLNGALQQRNADYSADNGTSVTFNVALQLNDVVDIVCTNNLVSGTVSNAANISYNGQFTGQTTRTVAAKLADVVSVKDFGAVGDGVANDTAALNAFFAAISGNNKPIGDLGDDFTFLFSQLNIPANIKLRGKSKLRCNGTTATGQVANVVFNGAVEADFLNFTTAGTESNVEFIWFYGSDYTIGSLIVESDIERTGTGGIAYVGSGNVLINYLKTVNIARPFAAATATPATDSPAENIHLDRVEIDGFIRGLKFENVSHWSVKHAVIKRKDSRAIYTPGHVGILIGQCTDWSLGHIHIEDSGEHGLRIGGNANPLKATERGIADYIFTRNTGATGVKLNSASTSGANFGIRDLTFNTIVAIDCGQAGLANPEGNHDGLRITDAENIYVGSFVNLAVDSTYSSNHSINLNSCRNIIIDSVYSVGTYGNMLRIDKDIDETFRNFSGLYINSFTGESSSSVCFLIEYQDGARTIGDIYISNINIGGSYPRLLDTVEPIIQSGRIQLKGTLRDNAPNFSLNTGATIDCDFEWENKKYFGPATGGIGFAAGSYVTDLETFNPAATVSSKASHYLETKSITPAQGVYGASLGFSRLGTTRRGAAIVAKQTGADGKQLGLAFFTANPSGTSATDLVTENLVLFHDGNLNAGANASQNIVTAAGHLRLRSYTVATLPSASTVAQLIYVSDGTSNKRLAISDGTNWRFPDGAVVS